MKHLELQTGGLANYLFVIENDAVVRTVRSYAVDTHSDTWWVYTGDLNMGGKPFRKVDDKAGIIEDAYDVAKMMGLKLVLD